MTGFQIISDLQRVVRIEAESALPDRPVRPETPRQPIGAGARLSLTIALRRLADAIEPATACLTPPSTAEGQRG